MKIRNLSVGKPFRGRPLRGKPFLRTLTMGKSALRITPLDLMSWNVPFRGSGLRNNMVFIAFHDRRREKKRRGNDLLGLPISQA